MSKRRYAVGAEVLGDGVSFRVWAPAHDTIYLCVRDRPKLTMACEEDGYFRLDVAGLMAGAEYRFALGQSNDTMADPVSRFQPQGPDGWSIVVDATRFQWRDADWKGIGPCGQVLYEIHIGTFTDEGTYRAAGERLPLLKEIGITCIEVMPLNEFPGAYGWGYDGVLPYAPSHLYGTPDDLRSFIDRAHSLGIAVILDVVYNHFGFGNRLSDFSPDYFTDRHQNDWGSSVNFDGPNSRPVRDFVTSNARYWIDEFHFDGLRLDAMQTLDDDSEEHIVAEIARAACAAASGRSIYLVGENERQDPRFAEAAEAGGYGLDALWNDDFHHSAMVALTGRREAYYHDHRGRAQEFVSAAKYGFLFQGQRYDWQNAARGRPSPGLRAPNFIHFLQNHDQIANSGSGARLDKIGPAARVRALTALLLLCPQTPMLFQGQEFGATSPFHYFADHSGDVGKAVREGRLDFLRQFPSLNDEGFCAAMPDPAARSTFEQCKLDWSERDVNRRTLDLHRDLLVLRKELAALWDNADCAIDGSTFGVNGLLLRLTTTAPENHQLLVLNLGPDEFVESLPDPLLAPPEGFEWAIHWSSEDIRYGGNGRGPGDLRRRVTISADCALIFRPALAQPHCPPDKAELKMWQDHISGLVTSRSSKDTKPST